MRVLENIRHFALPEWRWRAIVCVGILMLADIGMILSS